VAEAGYDPAYGARPLKRAITKYIEDPVAEFIISDRIMVSKSKELAEVRELKVGLAADKESITVSLKTP
jgi:ATP-dependent Clp protease ATP-binding subunit ClpA